MAGEGISPIGSLGLGSTGAYSSYDPMSMMMSGYGMNPMTSMMGGMNFMNPMMMGMNPVMGGNYMDQLKENYTAYNKMMEEIEERRLQHGIEMHRQKELAQVSNLSAHDQKFFLEAMEDGFIQQGIREIYDNIREGNLGYVNKKFYELKQEILNKYSDHFKNPDGSINSKENINDYIRRLYAKIAGSYNPGAPEPDMINDIKSYGETEFKNGLLSKIFPNSGHNTPTAEEALYQMFGREYHDKGSKQKMHQAGELAGGALQVAGAGLIGGTLGAAALGVAKFLTPDFITKHIPDRVATNSVVKWATKYRTAFKCFALPAAVIDFLWQITQ